MEAIIKIHPTDMRKLFAHFVACIEHHDPDNTCWARCCNANRGLLSFAVTDYEGFIPDYQLSDLNVGTIQAVRYLTCSGKGAYLFAKDGTIQFSGRRRSFGCTELFGIRTIRPFAIIFGNDDDEALITELTVWTSAPNVPLGDLPLIPA